MGLGKAEKGQGAMKKKESAYDPFHGEIEGDVEQGYFKNALSGFVFESASGAAIRHLADLGYTVKQIMEKLTYPAPYEKIQETVWKHLADTGVLLLKEPGTELPKSNVTYVKEYGKYGRVSLRQVTRPYHDGELPEWKKYQFQKSDKRDFPSLFIKMCMENEEETSYISCDFGLLLKKETEKFARVLQGLDNRQKDYIIGLPWEERIVYHRLNQRMRDIVLRMCENSWKCGDCYFGRGDKGAK